LSRSITAARSRAATSAALFGFQSTFKVASMLAEVTMTARGRWTGAGICMAAGFLGALMGNFARTPAHATGESVYRAQRFELVSPDGQVRAVLGFDPGDTSNYYPKLELKGPHASGRAVALGVTFEGGQLALNNAVTKSRIVLGNSVMAETAERRVTSDSSIEIDGRDARSVWRAP
jgi:hypothetical protein